MKTSDATDLIRSAIPQTGGTWADLGAGGGTFTRALVELLGEQGRVYAVDNSAQAIAALTEWSAASASNVTVVHGDFTDELPALPGNLDGILLANSLHFVRDGGAVLARLARLLRPGGRVVIVEYDRRAASRWVPYPVSIASLASLADAAGLTRPRVVESRPSNYEGIIYVAYAERP